MSMMAIIIDIFRERFTFMIDLNFSHGPKIPQKQNKK